MKMMLVIVAVAECARPFPRVYSKSGRHFNGWCARFTEADGASTSAIVGAFGGSKKEHLCAVLRRTAAGEASCEQRLVPDGETPRKGEILWRSKKAGSVKFTRDGVFEVNLLGLEATVDGRCGPLSADPEGWLGRVPWVLPCRYDVWTMNSPAKVDGRRALGHVEFNAGRTFPKGWIWAQAHDSTASLVAVGGDLFNRPFSWFAPPAFVLAVRSPHVHLTLRTTDRSCRVVSRTIDPLNKRLHLGFQTPSHRVDLDLSADPSSFFPDKILVPAKGGRFIPNAQESFAANARLRIYEVRLDTDSFRLIDERSFDAAALEFGGSYSSSSGL